MLEPPLNALSEVNKPNDTPIIDITSGIKNGVIIEKGSDMLDTEKVNGIPKLISNPRTINGTDIKLLTPAKHNIYL